MWALEGALGEEDVNAGGPWRSCPAEALSQGSNPGPQHHGLSPFPSALRVVVCGWELYVDLRSSRQRPYFQLRSHPQLPSRCGFGGHRSAQSRRP